MRKIYKSRDIEANNFVEKNRNVIVKFIADSGATEHLSKIKLIFEMLDDRDNHVIKCANKELGLNAVESGEV